MNDETENMDTIEQEQAGTDSAAGDAGDAAGSDAGVPAVPAVDADDLAGAIQDAAGDYQATVLADLAEIRDAQVLAAAGTLLLAGVLIGCTVVLIIRRWFSFG